MSHENQVLAIDAGNTSIKVAQFRNDNLVDVHRFQLVELSEFTSWIDSIGEYHSIVSSVLSVNDTEILLNELKNPLLVDNNCSFPIELDYETPETLGIDRICNAVFASIHAKTSNAVCIDLGTCIKFDLTVSSCYKGGSIAPGIDLRYQSLNDYTGNLPLLSNKSLPNLVGTSTNLSIQSGVMRGIQAEINQLIQQYEKQFDDLTFFMTGGDASSFDIESKNDIFADENLTLKGLYEIYKHNA